jgi:hypothetical protein
MILALLCAKQREESRDILDPACEGCTKQNLRALDMDTVWTTWRRIEVW